MDTASNTASDGGVDGGGGHSCTPVGPDRTANVVVIGNVIVMT